MNAGALRTIASRLAGPAPAPATGRYTHTAPHRCGGALTFVRDGADSHESCSGCGWFYRFGGQTADATATVRLTPAPGHTNTEPAS